MTWQFTLTGLLIGSIVGLTGMGGGSLMTPILDHPLRLQADVRRRHGHRARRDLQDVRRDAPPPARHGARAAAFWMFARLGPAGAAGVGPRTSSGIDRDAQTIQRLCVGVALIAGGIGFLAKSFVKRGVQPSEAPFIMSRRDKLIALGTGAVFGFIVGLTSVGSGTYFGLMMVLVYPLTMPRIVGTDIFHAAALLGSRGSGTSSSATSTCTRPRGSSSARCRES